VKAGTDSRNKTVLAGVLATAALIAVIVFLKGQFFDSGPAPAAAPLRTGNSGAAREMLTEKPAGNTAAASTDSKGLGAVPGVAAQRVANTSSSLDPTLDEAAMLRTESLVYTGTGRNIFSLIYTPPVVIPTNVPKVRAPQAPVVQTPPPPPLPCPPNCAPIPLKFFGTATRNNVRQAFLLSGEDVYLASLGDIVARRYKVNQIGANSVQIEDLTNHFTQTIPMSMQ
jgi:hypothetical protein